MEVAGQRRNCGVKLARLKSDRKCPLMGLEEETYVTKALDTKSIQLHYSLWTSGDGHLPWHG